MKALIASVGLGTLLMGGTIATLNSEVSEAQERLENGIVLAADTAKVATADDAEEAYCTPEFKQVLQRVLHACGLAQGGRRGCKPSDVQQLASISDEEFNALFTPLKDRGGVVMFADGVHELDDEGKALIEEIWADRRGARYFFVVARASKTGTRDFNQKLSHKRSNSVKFFVEDKFQEKELDKKMGLMWLGFDYAQLDESYCEWNVSHDKKGQCDKLAINRSAFISWVDCRL